MYLLQWLAPTENCWKVNVRSLCCNKKCVQRPIITDVWECRGQPPAAPRTSGRDARKPRLRARHSAKASKRGTERMGNHLCALHLRFCRALPYRRGLIAAGTICGVSGLTTVRATPPCACGQCQSIRDAIDSIHISDLLVAGMMG